MIHTDQPNHLVPNHLLSIEELLPYYTIKPFTPLSSIFFTATYNSNKKKCEKKENFKEHTLIAKNLRLGMLPNHGSDLYENHRAQIQLVVSVNTYPELAKSKMITPSIWQQLGVKHVHLHMPDFTADVSISDAITVIEIIRNAISDEEFVYLHCKAGMSRSATIATVYLHLFGDGEDYEAGKPLEEIVEYLKRLRVQVDISKAKIEKAKEIIEAYKKRQSNNELPKADEDITLESYLISLKAKNEIRHLTAFKELAIYATKLQKNVGTCKRSDDIAEFFSEIIFAQNSDWYHKLNLDRGPLQRLKNRNLSDKNDTVRRSTLIENFKTELSEHLKSLHLIENTTSKAEILEQTFHI